MQSQKTIHICLISAQLLPNLIPLLITPPEAVQLVVTEGMKKQAQRFRKILEQQNIQVVKTDQNCPDTGFNIILKSALVLVAKLEQEYAEWHIVLNATGGTKLMAFGFVEIFREKLPNAEIIYADTEHSQIEFLDKPERSPEKMKDVINVPVYLAAYGFTVRSSASDKADWISKSVARKPLTKYFASKSKELNNFFGAINRLANKALDDNGEKLGNATQIFEQPLRGEWRTAIQKIAESKHDLVTWYQKQQITFHSLDAARYLSGIWLEEYVWHIVNDAQPFDTQCSVEGTWEEGNKKQLPRNEFDILVTHRNRLLVIECKTSKFGRDESKDQDILYKLDALGTKAKGLFGATWLVSARPLDDTARSRAKSQGIEVIEAEQLTGLREMILKWMGTQ